MSTGPEYRVDRLDGKVVLRHMNWPGADGRDQVQFYTLVLLTPTVECVLGRTWRPPEIVVDPSTAPHLTNNERFSGARIRYSDAYTGVVVPDEMLASPVRVDTRIADGAPLPGPLGGDLLASLRAALRPYLADTRPRAGFAAEIAGMSERTFQRRLADIGLNDSKLLDQIRFEDARTALAERDRSITEIAFDLGFTDVSHFTRAFRRWADVSPRQYRRLYRGPRNADAVPAEAMSQGSRMAS